MDVKTLYTLVAIADRGSFAEAGNAIGLSLSAVSMQMRALEEELGMTIFDRSRRPPVLTDAGLAFTNRARDLLTHWESMSAALKRDAAGGVLKIGSVHTSVSGVLPLALKRMQQQGHRIDVHLTTGLTHELEKAVHRRQLDVAVVTEPEVQRLDLQFLPFVDEEFVVITHVTTRGDSDKGVLETTPYVRFNRAARVGFIVQEEMVRRQIAVRSIMEIDTLEGVIAMVANGLGSSVVPARGVENEFPPTIRTIPFGSPPLTRRLGILVPRDNPRSYFSNVLLDALRAVTLPGAASTQEGQPKLIERG
ncbi:LysR family transcriptional regulator [Pandoraea terrae]|uniref:LysR family transcriptional regulator n=1 Tax=Pandoraea terrae TaxID=1537710 RepID=A0A5E4Z066_9BURK|nr:LysR family transcriptional regulator [Pandoraea terrae]VVE54574.1 LysR family transcriptional regulator [Pandoraea terrae]